ncbi:MAG TPA: ABC transporter permease [Trueperaceae bacterium]|nr:ABC transporter permease [Trueperaceae bacterium]
MRAALLIALKDLRQRLRDRSFFIFGLLAPLSIAFVFNLLIGPLTQGTPNVPVIGYVDADASAASAGMRAVLGAAQDAGLITWRSLSDEDAARQAVRAGDVGAAVVVPAGFSGALGRSEVTALVVTSNRADYAARLAETLTDSYLARVRATGGGSG